MRIIKKLNEYAWPLHINAQRNLVTYPNPIVWGQKPFYEFKDDKCYDSNGQKVNYLVYWNHCLSGADNF